MDELKKWLLNRIGVNQCQDGGNWEERSYAYEAVLEKIEQIRSDDEFYKWYESQSYHTPKIVPQGEHCRNLCRQAWKAGSEHANKTGQRVVPLSPSSRPAT